MAAQHSTGTDNGHALLAKHRDDHGPFKENGWAHSYRYVS
jgi:hypothetical protein